uniref:C-type lectin domain-containing protein n=1 Tax=Anabas testudineus TaxID=64144 RepID=A0A3Q1HD18_ANATE
ILHCTHPNLGLLLLILLSNLMTWSSAQAYCRQHYTDMPIIENSAENAAVYSVLPNNVQAWIGLYRVPWKWSDKSNSPFRHWLSGQPDNRNGNEYCAAEDYLHDWSDLTCTTKLPFICHQGNSMTNKLICSYLITS